MGSSPFTRTKIRPAFLWLGFFHIFVTVNLYRMKTRSTCFLSALLWGALFSSCISRYKADSSYIVEESVSVTTGIVYADHASILVDAAISGLSGYDSGSFKKSDLQFSKYRETGYSLTYEIYNDDGILVEKGIQDMDKNVQETPFMSKELSIPLTEQYLGESYTLVLTLKLLNKKLSSVKKTFSLFPE